VTARAAGVITHRLGQQPGLVVAAAVCLKVGSAPNRGGQVQRHFTALTALNLHLQVTHTAAILPVHQVEPAHFGAAQAVIRRDGQ
jgi:hypothetical protein